MKVIITVYKDGETLTYRKMKADVYEESDIDIVIEEVGEFLADSLFQIIEEDEI